MTTPAKPYPEGDYDPDPVIDAIYKVDLDSYAKFNLGEEAANYIHDMLALDFGSDVDVTVDGDDIDVTLPDGTKRYFYVVATGYEIIGEERDPVEDHPTTEERMKARHEREKNRADLIRRLLEEHKARYTASQ